MPVSYILTTLYKNEIASVSMLLVNGILASHWTLITSLCKFGECLFAVFHLMHSTKYT